MKQNFSGGCACGAVRYECTDKPMMMFYCHCRDCQRASGGPYSPAIIVPTRNFKVTNGTPSYFSVPSDAGGMHTRGFCPECGSRLFGAVKPELPFIGIVASSLDDPTLFQPQFHIFAGDAQPWDHLEPKLPKHERYAPEMGARR